MSIPELHPSTPSTTPTRPTLPRSKRPWWLLVPLLLTVGVVGAALVYWFYPMPLTPAEQQLVGKWAMPMVPNPPPNAVRTVYELGPDRRLTVISQVVSGVDEPETMTGTWRVEEGHLVLDARGQDYRPVGEKILRGFGMSSSKLFGDAPEPPHMKARFRLLEVDKDVFHVEDEPENVVPFLRQPD